jgi:DNA-binding transcriptional regulator YhcF (GntR family)
MVWQLDTDRPIYAQLIEQISLRILTGEYPAGSRLPSVRDIAAEAAVNPNTMQRALAELERDGLVYSVRTSGRFITEDEERIAKMKDKMAREIIKGFLSKMNGLGYDNEEAVRIMQKAVKEITDDGEHTRMQ